MFENFDADHDGTISAKELGTVMRQLGHNPSDAELKAMVREVDQDNDGEINFEEFLGMMARQMNTDSDRDEIREAFAIFDKNGDGSIDSKELQTVMESLGEKLTEMDIKTMMDGADTDRDGKISFEEFAAMMRK